MVIDAIGYAGQAGFLYPAASERVSEPMRPCQDSGESLVDPGRSPLTKVLQQTLSELAGSNCDDPIVRSAVVDANISLAGPAHTGQSQIDGFGGSSLQLFSLVCRAMALPGNAIPPKTDDASSPSGATGGSDTVSTMPTIAEKYVAPRAPADGTQDTASVRDRRDTLSEYTDDRDRKAVGRLIDLVA